jgi:putative transposase
VIDDAISQLKPIVGVRRACRAVGEDQARFYRRHRLSPAPVKAESLPGLQPRALTEAERTEVHDTLNSAEFVDQSPPAVYATLLDSGIYLCSVPTMYRVLKDHDEVHERRRQATHPATVKPELVAEMPNQVWSWDITKLHGPVKWTYFYLYVVIDIFSRYVTGWMLARAENAHLAKVLISEAVAKQRIVKGQLSLHMDRGSPMRAKPFAFLLADLGVTKSFSRPHVSDDNPYSESHFRTFKYRPAFPDRFGCFEDAEGYCRRFFSWYNDEHRHSGIGYHTPSDVHYGRAEAMREQRQKALNAAYAAHPERFVRKPPVPPVIPVVSWINEPKEVGASTQ